MVVPFRNSEQTCFKTIQLIDITGPLQPCSTTEYKYYTTVCPHCHKSVKAASVTGNCKKVMYGPVLQTKVSGGFRTNEGADEFAAFHSIAETAKRNGISKFKALFKLVADMAPGEDFIEKLIAEND